MAETLFPGVYVEETTQPKPIEGVDTSTAGFVGPTHKGPRSRKAHLVTSLAEFEHLYGGPRALRCGPNYLWYAVRAFFEEGGHRLYIARVLTGKAGIQPTLAAYESALQALGELNAISIVAAPGCSANPQYPDIDRALIAHAQKLHNRVVVLDTPSGKSVAEVEQIRAGIDSSYAALYYPWVIVDHAAPGNGAKSGVPMTVPPSGFICGLYARAPLSHGAAHEGIRSASRTEADLTDAHLELLVQHGVNCLRVVHDRGLLVWGARMATSDPDYRYLPLRRYTIFLESSIQNGLQWAVFEPNGEQLWDSVRRTVSDFLLNEWATGALLGDKPERAFFVRCDRTTMTQADIDNGRLICEIGVAAVKPAEFVIIRIGQWTAGRCPTC